MVIAVEIKLRPALIDILKRSKEYTEKPVDISAGLNVYESIQIQEHTMQNIAGKPTTQQSRMSELP